jgi:hypothetical protein
MSRSVEKFGQDFAEAIKSIAAGGPLTESQKRKLYSPTRTVFWEEQRFNPRIEYAHISHECDAQLKEGERYWKKQGKKFTGEPRFPPYVKRCGDGVLETGYLLPAEIPQFNEREVVYFEKEHKSQKPVRLPKNDSVSKKKKKNIVSPTSETPTCYYRLSLCHHFYSLLPLKSRRISPSLKVNRSMNC